MCAVCGAARMVNGPGPDVVDRACTARRAGEERRVGVSFAAIGVRGEEAVSQQPRDVEGCGVVVGKSEELPLTAFPRRPPSFHGSFHHPCRSG
eukprot:7485215-Prorocentrum_lima.AAC.1